MKLFRVSVVSTLVAAATVVVGAGVAIAADDQVTNLAGTSEASAQVTLTFTQPIAAPAAVGTDPATLVSYDIAVLVSGVEVGTAASCLDTDGTTSQSCTVNGYTAPAAVVTTPLTNGTAYTFSVSGVWEVDTGAGGLVKVTGTPTTSGAVTPYTTPNAPAGLTSEVVAVSGTNKTDRVKVSWSAVTDAATGGSAITGYTVKFYNVATQALTSTTLCSGSDSGTTTSRTICGLSANTSYSFKVLATNARGDSVVDDGTANDVGSQTETTFLTVPAAPTIQTVTLDDTGATGDVTVTWTAPGGTGTITDYGVMPTDGGVDTTEVTTGDNTLSKKILEGTGAGKLTLLSQYKFKVRTKNATGWGPYTDPSPADPLTISKKPDAPSVSTANDGGTGTSATITWTKPAENGSSITSYLVQAYNAGNKENGKTCTNAVLATRSCSVTGLAAGTAYTFKVTATNARGTSAESSASSEVTILAAGTAQTIDFAALTQKQFGDSFSVSATSKAGSTNTGLTVSFASLDATVCTVAGSTVTVVGKGTCTIRATQAGDATYAAAVAVDQSFTTVARSLTIDADDKTITFGDSTPTFSGTQTGTLVNPDTISSLSSLTYSFSGNGYGPSATPPTAVGVYTITPAGASITSGTAGNYSINYTTGTFTINDEQTVDFAALGAKTYGDSTFAVSATSKKKSNSATTGLTIAFSSQTTSVCTLSGSTVTIVKAGTCTIRGAQAGGLDSSNSNRPYAAATNVDRSFTVNAKAITLAAENKSKQVGAANPSFTFTRTGSLVGSDAISGVSYEFSGNGYGPSETPPSAAGVYTVTPKSAAFSAGLAANYAITYTAGTFTITAAPETPAPETPSNNTPSNNTPSNNTPSNNTPSNNTPSNNTPSLLSPSAGTEVPITREPTKTIAQDAGVAVSNQKVTVALLAPTTAKTSATSITKYIVTLKPTTKGAPVITKTITVTPGKKITAAISGKKGTSYQVVVTALTKAGKKLTWNGPKVTTKK